MLHLRHEPLRCCFGCVAKSRLSREPPCPGAELQQRSVVVEHLLEMGDHPRVVHGVAVETAAKLIEYATPYHPGQGKQGGLPCLGLICVAGEQQAQVLGMWKLGCTAEAAMTTVELIQQQADTSVDKGVVQAAPVIGFDLGLLVQRFYHLAALCFDGLALLLPGGGDVLQQAGKAWKTAAGTGREVGAGVKRNLGMGIEEDGEGPAAGPSCKQLMRMLVEFVQVRAFLPVHLDVDEQLVHQAGGLLVLEGFVGHDMTPVTGRITDGQQNGPVLFTGGMQSLGAPGPPVHGVVGVLLQVGAGCAGQTVLRFHAGSVPRGRDVSTSRCVQDDRAMSEFGAGLNG